MISGSQLTLSSSSVGLGDCESVEWLVRRVSGGSHPPVELLPCFPAIRPYECCLPGAVCSRHEMRRLSITMAATLSNAVSHFVWRMESSGSVFVSSSPESLARNSISPTTGRRPKLVLSLGGQYLLVGRFAQMKRWECYVQCVSEPGPEPEGLIRHLWGGHRL